MSTINYYGVLGISEKSSSQDIKKSYKKLALKFHPDKNNNAGSEEKFKKIGEAYAHLKDPVKKADFDKKLNDYSSAIAIRALLFFQNLQIGLNTSKTIILHLSIVLCVMQLFQN